MLPLPPHDTPSYRVGSRWLRRPSRWVLCEGAVCLQWECAGVCGVAVVTIVAGEGGHHRGSVVVPQPLFGRRRGWTFAGWLVGEDSGLVLCEGVAAAYVRHSRPPPPSERSAQRMSCISEGWLLAVCEAHCTLRRSNGCSARCEATATAARRARPRFDGTRTPRPVGERARGAWARRRVGGAL